MNRLIRDEYYIALCRAPTDEARVQILRSICHMARRGRLIDTTTVDNDRMLQVAEYAMTPLDPKRAMDLYPN